MGNLLVTPQDDAPLRRDAKKALDVMKKTEASRDKAAKEEKSRFETLRGMILTLTPAKKKPWKLDPNLSLKELRELQRDLTNRQDGMMQLIRMDPYDDRLRQEAWQSIEEELAIRAAIKAK